jgi:hypothetical protein
MKKPIAYAIFHHSQFYMPHYASELVWADSPGFVDGKTMFDCYGNEGSIEQDSNGLRRVIPLTEFDGGEEQ